MAHKVKISIITPVDVFGYSIGGINTFIKGFIKYAPEDFDIEIIGITENKKERPVGKWMELELGRKTFRNHPVFYTPNANKRGLIPLTLKFTLALFKHHIDTERRILEFHRIEPMVKFWHSSNKKILFVHGNISYFYNPHSESKWSKFPWLYFWLERRLISKMKRIFVVTKEGVKFHKTLYPHISHKFSFLPTWVDEDIFYPYSEEIRRKQKDTFLSLHGLNRQDNLIIFAGRLEKAKDPLLLIETFHYIHKKEPLTKLFIIGSGSLRKKIDERITRYNLEKHIKFLGALPQSELAEIMRISDAFLLTSGFEGMPMSVLEALACGVPVISPNVGEVRRTVIDGLSGIVAHSRTPEELGDAVVKILSDKDRFKSENCLSAIKPYLAKTVLAELYEYHYKLSEGNSA